MKETRGRKKKDITLDSYLRIRIENSVKIKYLLFCKKHKIKFSEHLRSIVINTIKNK